MRFTEFLDRYEIPYLTSGHHHCREGWVQLDCPWCGRNTHKWHMGFNLRDHYVNCWRCGSHRLIPTLVELTGLWPSRVREELGWVEKERSKCIVRPWGTYQPPKNLTELTPLHCQYLRQRRFEPAVLQRLWWVRSIGLSARLSWRLFIPIVLHGEEVSWTTRSTAGDSRKRYVSAAATQESVPRSQLLYGWDYVRHAAIVCEGPTDVWRIGPGAVATLSTQFSQAQVELLSRLSRRVICYDNEPAAQRRAKQLRDQLLAFEGETFCVQLDAKDPGSASRAEVRQLRSLLD